MCLSSMRATFAISLDGSVEILNANRVHPHANRMYAQGHHPLTRHERLIIRVMRDVHCPAHIAGLDVQAISCRDFTPN